MESHDEYIGVGGRVILKTGVEINLIQDREHCWAFVDKIMNLRFPNVTFSKVALLREVRGGNTVA